MSGKILRSVALPAEHGAWSLWLEPVLLALLIAPTSAGIIVAVLSLASLLTRQPLKIMLIDLRKRRVYQRTQQAALFVFLYAVIAIAALSALIWRGGADVILPLIPAYIGAAVIIWRFDLGGNSRAWLPEALAATVMAAFAVSICRAGGWTWEQAGAVGAIMLARAVPAIIYVRARLRQIKADDDRYLVAIALHAIAFSGLLVLARFGFAPILSAIASLFLLGRAIYFLRFGARVAPKIVGMQEVTIGLIFVALVAAGFILSI